MNMLRLFYFAGIFFYLYLPISVLIVNAFNLNKYGMKWDGFTCKWFTAMLENHSLMEATRHSVVIAVCAATLATIIGALAAIGLNRYRFFQDRRNFSRSDDHFFLLKILVSPPVMRCPNRGLAVHNLDRPATVIRNIILLNLGR